MTGSLRFTASCEHSTARTTERGLTGIDCTVFLRLEKCSQDSIAKLGPINRGTDHGKGLAGEEHSLAAVLSVVGDAMINAPHH